MGGRLVRSARECSNGDAAHDGVPAATAVAAVASQSSTSHEADGDAVSVESRSGRSGDRARLRRPRSGAGGAGARARRCPEAPHLGRPAARDADGAGRARGAAPEDGDGHDPTVSALRHGTPPVVAGVQAFRRLPHRRRTRSRNVEPSQSSARGSINSAGHPHGLPPRLPVASRGARRSTSSLTRRGVPSV